MFFPYSPLPLCPGAAGSLPRRGRRLSFFLDPNRVRWYHMPPFWLAGKRSQHRRVAQGESATLTP